MRKEHNKNNNVVYVMMTTMCDYILCRYSTCPTVIRVQYMYMIYL